MPYQQLNLPRSLFFHATFGTVSPCTIAMSAARMLHASRAVGVLYKAHSTPHIGVHVLHLASGPAPDWGPRWGFHMGAPEGTRAFESTQKGYLNHPGRPQQVPWLWVLPNWPVSFFLSGAQWAARAGPAAAGRGCAAREFECWGPKGGPCLGPAPPGGSADQHFHCTRFTSPLNPHVPHENWGAGG